MSAQAANAGNARRARLLVTGLIMGLLMLSPALAAGTAWAQEAETGDGGEVGAAAQAPEPAVAVPDDAPQEPDPEWSYRFLVPTALVLGTVAVVGAIIMYFVRVTRNRYRVVK